MSLFDRLIAASSPDADDKIPVHVWPKMFHAWRRGRLTLSQVLDAWTPTLVDFSQTITAVVTAPNRLTVGASHGYVVDDPVQFRNTGGALPAPLDTDEIYYVITTDTDWIRVSSMFQGTTVDITDAGSGTNTCHKIDNDVGAWARIRNGITDADNKTQRSLRLTWDDQSEGIAETAEYGAAWGTAVELETELQAMADFINNL